MGLSPLSPYTQKATSCQQNKYTKQWPHRKQQVGTTASFFWLFFVKTHVAQKYIGPVHYSELNFTNSKFGFITYWGDGNCYHVSPTVVCQKYHNTQRHTITIRHRNTAQFILTTPFHT
jgi:hypothetical protein